MKDNKEIRKVEHTENNAEQITNQKVFVPAADIYETEREIILLADMPGVDEKSVDIHLEGSELTVHGKVSSDDVSDLRMVIREYPVGNYKRVFSITDKIDRGKIKASMKNGELKLILPKQVPVSKQIEVVAG
jgi:HSP20 family molecular chaperone IbpA